MGSLSGSEHPSEGAEKKFTIGCKDGRRYEGTLEELTARFRYILMAGNSYNQRIRLKPQDARRLVMHLNMAVRVSQKTSENKYFLVKRKWERKRGEISPENGSFNEYAMVREDMTPGEVSRSQREYALKKKHEMSEL